METHSKHRTPIHKGMVFTGTGTGTKKYTHGLPMSYPRNEEQESVMMDSKRVMREHNPWGCYYHQMGFAGVLETWCDDSNEA